ncbi:hypothetical protein MLD38_012142 [Melastoma candidum]|uniref:Uncharacterized protein n=1 Tax=Melastoma candidum TaxID=119954 RepID=A0ACB9RDU0_9MYRT|nr:hypothetical protein MLD38_012142 [Melastoma candidum]
MGNKPFYFISHFGADTKMNIAALLHWEFTRQWFGSFLDFESLDLGHNIPHKIEEAILKCTIAVIILSPGFCASKHCLNEVLMFLEENKPILPIFWNIKPSELEEALEKNEGSFPESDMEKYRAAIKKVKHVQGIVFQSKTG